MSLKNTVVIVMMSVALAAGQRPSFAGSRPIGYPEVIKPSTEDSLANRLGEDGGTTERLPIEANGDRDLVERLSKLPIDQQPFWYINWKAYEAHRKNPQTFPQKPNVFLNPPPANTQSGQNLLPNNSQPQANTAGNLQGGQNPNLPNPIPQGNIAGNLQGGQNQKPNPTPSQPTNLSPQSIQVGNRNSEFDHKPVTSFHSAQELVNREFGNNKNTEVLHQESQKKNKPRTPYIDN